VVGAIVPWNFPVEVTLNKLGQALATGNTVVLKPAPDTPWNATRLGRLIAEQTDIPAGVVNVVTSSDHLLGEQLTLSPQVDLISFTGSTAVGKRIMEKGSTTMKRLFLELGGKSATIVLDDADFGTALQAGMAVCFHAGQGCAIPTRMLLPRSRYEEGVEMLKAMFTMIPYGDPQRPDVMMGPVISAKQRQRILEYIEVGQADGATLALGGRQPEHLDRGFYVEPTLFTEVDNSMRIAQEEIFGPVLVVIPFEDDDDAVRIANDSIYGLAGMVFSELPSTEPSRVAHRVRDRDAERQWGPRIRAGHALRRLQAQRRRPAERNRRVRAVPRDEIRGVAASLRVQRLDQFERIGLTPYLDVLRVRTADSSSHRCSRRTTAPHRTAVGNEGP
jgi:aldehyde dehydrogenase (NAD+)